MAGCQDPGPLEELEETVKPYGRHVLVCAGWVVWPERIEERDDLLGRVGREVKRLGDEIDPPPKVTALRTEPVDEAAGLDLIVFPDRVAYHGVDGDAWVRIRDQHLAGGQIVEDLAPDPVEGHHVLVCNHGARDVRCGACGPLVADALEDAINTRGAEAVTVHRSSHVGGHRFAGNVITYPGGDWYGYVRPGDAHRLLDAILEEGAAWSSHHRGSMIPPGSQSSDPKG